MAILHSEIAASSESADDNRVAIVALQSELSPLVDEVTSLTLHLCATVGIQASLSNNAATRTLTGKSRCFLLTEAEETNNPVFYSRWQWSKQFGFGCCWSSFYRLGVQQGKHLSRIERHCSTCSIAYTTCSHAPRTSSHAPPSGRNADQTKSHQRDAKRFGIG